MRNILVTGCSRGLGLGICQRLVTDGFQVLGVARTCSEPFVALAEQGAGQGKAHFLSFDVGDIDAIPPFLNRIFKEYGPIYGLVNNAAIGTDGVLATMHRTDISRLLRINIEAVITLTKYACRPMLVRSEGRIVNISSIIARTGFSGLTVYAASKAAIEGFTRSLARELGRAKITANCVAPGFVETDMTKDLPSAKLETIRRRSPLGLAGIMDIAAAVSYLIGPDGAHVTGTTLTVDGGSTA